MPSLTGMTSETLNIAERTETIALIDTGRDHVDKGWLCHRVRVPTMEEREFFLDNFHTRDESLLDRWSLRYGARGQLLDSKCLAGSFIFPSLTTSG